MRIVLLTSLLLVAALSVGAGAAASQSQGAAIVHPTGANKVVLRVSSGGGFVPCR